jgi:hypothetical protein
LLSRGNIYLIFIKVFSFYQGIFPLKVNTLTFSPVELRWHGLKGIFLIKKLFYFK